MNWPHFTEDEMRCKCGCGRCEMDKSFMVYLEAARDLCGFPFPPGSAFRCAAHDLDVGQSSTPGSGPHTTGKAIDIKVRGERKHQLAKMAMKLGFTGIGVYDWGLHLDYLTNAERPRPRIWGG